jgi:hypothetical protein
MLIEGTDDVPSSGGHCIRSVAGLSHVQMLHVSDGRGNWGIWSPSQHGTLHPDSLAAIITNGNYRWQPGEVRVAWQGYGSFADGKGWRTTERDPIVMVRVETRAGTRLAVLQLVIDPEHGSADTRALGRSVEGAVLAW